MQSDDPEVLTHAAAVVGSGERHVPGPSGVTRAAGAEDARMRRRRHEESRVHHDATERDQPERQRVDARKRHVARADHERHHVVPEARPDRDDPQEDHRRPVHREDLVVLLGREEGVLRLGKLDADQQRHHTADQEEEEGREQVHDRDLLVVDRGDPAEDPFRLVEARELRAGQCRVHDRHQDPPRLHDLLVGSIVPAGITEHADWNWFIGSDDDDKGHRRRGRFHTARCIGRSTCPRAPRSARC